ncbi:MAG TPA: glycoside hydrolase family 15 protein, partial [Steroidobacteraceae bacterium]|nr:glycoside hydrolase family 15 protein [Steroidobacteraceae bacterium]
GDDSHGRWLLRPVDAEVCATRSYRDDTLILETRYESADASVLVIDFMPPRGINSDVVRLVVGERGTMHMRTELVVRFGYGAVVPWFTRIGEGEWKAVGGPDMVVLRTPVKLHGENLHTVSEFDVRAGETVPFVLTYSESHKHPPRHIDELRALQETETFWRSWVKQCEYDGPHRDAVIRSLITLRALIYAPTGGIVAAATTSLPEQFGGPRNWDYRYCWIRDATLTLLAFMNAGYSKEAGAWRDWLVRAVAGSPRQMQIMYGVAGERRLTEWEVPWLPGYEESKPVRIGNLAHAQLQLDVFGEVMDALHQARKAGLKPDDSAWAVQRELLEHLADMWREPDYGMWEVRGPARHFTYSKVMCWVAFDRAIKSAERFKLEGPLDRWHELREQIHRDICANGFDSKLNSFTQSYGSSALDASLLLIPSVGFLPANDARVQGTIAAIERDLLRDGFVLRYRTDDTDDGLPGDEGAFIACSFWLADAYAMTGRIDKARELFERLLSVRNDLGLLAEEYHAPSKRLLGNFPQAFSHVALLGTAYNLARAAKPAEQRSEQHVPAPG